MEPIKVTITTHSKLWTGNIKRTGENLVMTGIIGSFRWWMEALVRGLNGYACDHTSNDSCKFDTSEYRSRLVREGSLSAAFNAGFDDVCPVCRIFGCNGYKGSLTFTLESNISGDSQIGIPARHSIVMTLNQRRILNDREKWLLQKTFELVSQYGSIGGKTTLKPYSNSNNDYGIVSIQVEGLNNFVSISDVNAYVSNCKKKKTSLKQPNLNYFWFLPAYSLTKQQINELLMLDEKGKPRRVQQLEFYEFLRGLEERETKEKDKKGNPIVKTKKYSKKVFSFYGTPPNGSDGNVSSLGCYTRTWGYVRTEDELSRVIEMIRDVIQDKQVKIIKGSEIVNNWR